MVSAAEGARARAANYHAGIALTQEETTMRSAQ